MFAQLSTQRANIATQNRPYSFFHSFNTLSSPHTLVYVDTRPSWVVFITKSLNVLMQYFFAVCVFHLHSWNLDRLKETSALPNPLKLSKSASNQADAAVRKQKPRGFASRSRPGWVYDSNSRGSKHCNDTLTVPMKCHFTTWKGKMTPLKETPEFKTIIRIITKESKRKPSANAALGHFVGAIFS